MSYPAIFDRLWKTYAAQNAQVLPIRQLFEDRGDTVVNDHVALRTFNHPKVCVDFLAHAFTDNGYVECGTYEFPVKKLFAKHYEHKTDKQAPKVFISELLVNELSDFVQETVERCVNQIPASITPEALLFSETPWKPLSHEIYQKLLLESEYAAWLYAYGYRANHFTVNINELDSFSEVSELNDFLMTQGFELNSAGGLVKGTPADLLEQSSTLASKQTVHFKEGDFEIPGCYFEFAKRYAKPDGELYTGFVAASADKIFESTNVSF